MQPAIRSPDEGALVAADPDPRPGTPTFLGGHKTPRLVISPPINRIFPLIPSALDNMQTAITRKQTTAVARRTAAIQLPRLGATARLVRAHYQDDKDAHRSVEGECPHHRLPASRATCVQPPAALGPRHRLSSPRLSPLSPRSTPRSLPSLPFDPSRLPLTSLCALLLLLSLLASQAASPTRKPPPPPFKPRASSSPRPRPPSPPPRPPISRPSPPPRPSPPRCSPSSPRPRLTRTSPSRTSLPSPARGTSSSTAASP